MFVCLFDVFNEFNIVSPPSKLFWLNELVATTAEGQGFTLVWSQHCHQAGLRLLPTNFHFSDFFFFFSRFEHLLMDVKMFTLG